jgi:hypothetical protein
MLKWVGVEHCDHSAPGGIIFQCPIMPLAAKMFYCSIWPWRYKCFIVLFGPWRYNGYKHVTPLGSFLYYTFRNKYYRQTLRNTAPEHCVHRVKTPTARTHALLPPFETPITYSPAIPSPFRLMLFVPFHLISLYQTDF